VAISFIGGGNRSTRGETHWLAAGHWQTSSHFVSPVRDANSQR